MFSCFHVFMFSCLLNINLSAQDKGDDGSTIQGYNPPLEKYEFGMSGREFCTDPRPDIKWLTYDYRDTNGYNPPVYKEKSFAYNKKVGGSVVNVGTVKYYYRIKTNRKTGESLPLSDRPTEVYIDLLRVWFCPKPNVADSLIPIGNRIYKLIQEEFFQYLETKLSRISDSTNSNDTPYFKILEFPRLDFTQCKIMFKIPCSARRIDELNGCYRWLPCSNKCCDIWYDIKRATHNYTKNGQTLTCDNHAEVSFNKIVSNVDTVPCISPDLYSDECEIICDSSSAILFNRDTLTLNSAKIKSACGLCETYEPIYAKQTTQSEFSEFENANATIKIYTSIGEYLGSINTLYSTQYNYNEININNGLYFIQWFAEDGKLIQSKSVYINR